MHLTISYEEPQWPEVNDNTKTKDHKVFSGIDHCHSGKIWNITSHFFFYLIFIGVYQFWYFSSTDINDNYEH